MPRSTVHAIPGLLLLVAACSSGSSSSSSGETDAGTQVDVDSGAPAEPADAAPPEAGVAPTDAGDDGGDAGDGGGCAVSGAPGDCIDVSACAALGDHTSFPGYCAGPATIECCIVTPDTADNPPVPAGYELMAQSQVTPDMTTWAVQILDDPTDYPMFATATKTFGTLAVLARVEWHPPDFQNSAVHRGVTLYEPILTVGRE